MTWISISACADFSRVRIFTETYKNNVLWKGFRPASQFASTNCYPSSKSYLVLKVKANYNFNCKLVYQCSTKSREQNIIFKKNIYEGLLLV